MTESEIQAEIMDYLLMHPKIVFAYVTTTGKIKGRGGHWITLGFAGMADIIAQIRGTGQIVAIEVKRPGELPTPAQAEFLDTVRNGGGISGWADSVEMVEAILL